MKTTLAALVVTLAMFGGAFAQENLTSAQAEKLVTGKKGTVALNQLKALSPEVAAVLARYDEELSLDGLETLSPEAAAALAKHKASARFGTADISLDGLTQLAPDTAAALATHQGALALKSLRTLDSLPLAQKLARQWGELQLNGLTTLTPEIAVVLATNEGVLVDRTRPGVEQRRADHAASVLRFDSLTAIAPASAGALAKQKGVLVLNGLTGLAPDTAAALAKHEGTLVLNGLTTLSVECAKDLAHCPSALVLKGLTVLPPEARTALYAHPNIRLPEAFQK